MAEVTNVTSRRLVSIILLSIIAMYSYCRFLQQKCAWSGSCSLTREAIAKKIELSPVTVSKYSAILPNRRLITVFEARHTNVYTVDGLRADFPESRLHSPMKPSCSPSCGRGADAPAIVSLFHAEIGKAIGWNWHVVKRTSAKLNEKGLIVVTYHQGRHKNIYDVPGGKPHESERGRTERKLEAR
jgi:hypothetical protein